MVSTHVRPPEIEDRQMPGHWEGDLIKGKANASPVGTLLERVSGYLMLVKMNDTTAMTGFSAALNGMPLTMRKSIRFTASKSLMLQRQLNIRVALSSCNCRSI